MKAIDAIVPPVRKLVNRHSLIRTLFMPVRYCFRLLFYTELHDSIERRSIWLERRLLNNAAKHFECYREKFRGKRCFVIGNGPSLNELDLTKLKDELTIGSNGLYLNYERMGFYPTFYTVTNSLIAEQMGAHIANIEESIKVFPLFLLKYFQHVKGEVNFLRTIAGYIFSQNVTNWISWQSTVTYFNLQIAFSLRSRFCKQV